MSNILSFPSRRVSPVAAREPVEAQPETEREPLAIGPGPRRPKVLLSVPLFEALTAALGFYAHQGHDHGQRARAALGAFTPNPQQEIA